MPVSQAASLEELVLDGCLAGLRDAGWAGDPRLVRLGYTAAVALRWGVIANLLRAATDDAPWQVPSRPSEPSREEFIAQRAALSLFLLERADQGRELISLVR